MRQFITEETKDGFTLIERDLDSGNVWASWSPGLSGTSFDWGYSVKGGRMETETDISDIALEIKMLDAKLRDSFPTGIDTVGLAANILILKELRKNNPKPLSRYGIE